MTLIPTVTIPPQSHSSLNTFETCPRQYYHKYVARDVKFKPSYDSEWGDNAHLHLENFVNAQGNYQIPHEVHAKTGQSMRDYQWSAETIMERAARRGGYVLAERQFGLTHDHATADYWDKGCWLRGKIDITVLYPKLGEAEVFDYKTGKRKDDPEQCVLYSASAFVDYTEVKTVRAAYVWLKESPATAIGKPLTYARDQLPQMLGLFDKKYAMLKDAYADGVFPPKPNGLCARFCDIESCEFYGRGRR